MDKYKFEESLAKLQEACDRMKAGDISLEKNIIETARIFWKMRPRLLKSWKGMNRND